MKFAESIANREPTKFHARTYMPRSLNATMSVTALLLVALTSGTHVVYAQEDDASDQSERLEEIVVSGTRVVRDGYETPTPVTVLGLEELESFATTNIADYVNTLPSFVNSTTPTSSTQAISGGNAGLNVLNLRSLGGTRTLVLLDGQRTVGADVTGVADINLIPQQLVRRVDVVTGGASAAYGSDAVAGVVNFVLDRNYTGIKASASTGITSEGDDSNYTLGLSGGMPFADGRGHFLWSGEYSESSGITGAERDWNAERGWQWLLNPDYTANNGEPERLLLDRTTTSTTTPGGMIIDTALRGTAFGPGGVPRQFGYGDIVTLDSMRGGEWQSLTTDLRSRGESLAPEQTRKNAFLRLSYELTDSVEVFAQFSSLEHWSTTTCCTHMFPRGVTVGNDNPFRPAEVSSQLVALGEPTATIGTSLGDLVAPYTDFTRQMDRIVIGANGEIDAFGSAWSWNAYYQNGRNTVTNILPEIMQTNRLREAADATVDPGTGETVCRSTLTDPGNGCVPFNIFGTGVNSEEQIDYVLGEAWRVTDIEQDVFEASIQGEPFSNWEGPVSMAAGLAYREESVSGTADELSSEGAWYLGNYRIAPGSYDVTEGFVETVVPLASNLSMVDAWDLNGAVRFADYSTAGNVTTWKIGTTYSPVEDLRFRLTRSLDIRAPNLDELYAPGTAATNSVIDPFNNNQNVAYLQQIVGNLNLRAEEADTTSFGVVFQPSILPGFSAAVDYWNIELNDAIDNVSPQDVVDLCFQGNQDFCAAITREQVGGIEQITEIRISPFNLQNRVVRGIDVEATYQISDTLWGGDLTIRALATHYMEASEDDGLVPPTDVVGENTNGGVPDWQWRGFANYSNGPLGLRLGLRGVSSGVFDNNFIECTAGCPTSTVTNRTVNTNYLDGAVYSDLSLSYTFEVGDRGAELRTFVNINNVADKDPSVTPGGPGGFPWHADVANSGFYDIRGRTILVGLKYASE